MPARIFVDLKTHLSLLLLYRSYSARKNKVKPRIMYIECKAGGLSGGEARIGRVTFSKTGQTIYYTGRTFHKIPGGGFKANYYEESTGDEYWISGPRKDGKDRLYGERVAVVIDEDVRDEYWTKIRNLPNESEGNTT